MNLRTGKDVALPEAKRTAWTVLREQAGSVEMPEDWATEHDHYLYGTPKRETQKIKEARDISRQQDRAFNT